MSTKTEMLSKKLPADSIHPGFLHSHEKNKLHCYISFIYISIIDIYGYISVIDNGLVLLFGCLVYTRFFGHVDEFGQ